MWGLFVCVEGVYLLLFLRESLKENKGIISNFVEIVIKIGGFILEKIFNTEIYKEVLELSNKHGYSLNIFTFSDDSNYAKIANGTHDFDFINKKIDIGIIESQSDNLAIYIHELLHAKLTLNGYPKIKTYGSLGGAVDNAILEIENIAHHTFIYPEMKRLGYEHNDLDVKYVVQIIADTENEFTGGNEINRALRLFEGYLRIPKKINEIEDLVKVSQPKAYKLYRAFRKYLKFTKTQFDMRTAVVNIIKYVDDYVKKELDNDLMLRYLTRIEPIFTTSELKQKASNIFKAAKLTNCEHTFLLKRKDNYCCYFLGLDINLLNQDLENMTVLDLLNKYSLMAYKKG